MSTLSFIDLYISNKDAYIGVCLLCSFVITLSHSVREVCFKNLNLHSDKRGPNTAVTWFLFEFWCFLLSTFVSHHLIFCFTNADQKYATLCSLNAA